jgi:hypothetical protein
MALAGGSNFRALVGESGLRNRKVDVLIMLTERGLSVTLSACWTRPDGIVDSDVIVVHKAPSSVLQRIVEECVLVSLTPDGLLIPVE